MAHKRTIEELQSILQSTRREKERMSVQATKQCEDVTQRLANVANVTKRISQQKNPNSKISAPTSFVKRYHRGTHYVLLPGKLAEVVETISLRASHDGYFMAISSLSGISIIDTRYRYWYHLYEISVYMYIFICIYIGYRYRYLNSNSIPHVPAQPRHQA